VGVIASGKVVKGGVVAFTRGVAYFDKQARNTVIVVQKPVDLGQAASEPYDAQAKHENHDQLRHVGSFDEGSDAHALCSRNPGTTDTPCPDQSGHIRAPRSLVAERQANGISFSGMACVKARPRSG
jgi:hypothetical protein